MTLILRLRKLMTFLVGQGCDDGEAPVVGL